MSKHTQGQWEVFIDDTGGENTGYPISISSGEKTVVRQGGFYPYVWDDKLSKDEIVANSRLIAAAPDLLELLEEMVLSFIDIAGDHCDDCEKLIRRAEQVIAKAKVEL